MQANTAIIWLSHGEKINMEGFYRRFFLFISDKNSNTKTGVTSLKIFSKSQLLNGVQDITLHQNMLQ